MTDFGGGRVYIEAVADASNIRRDLQAKIDAAIAGVRLTVPVEADPEHLRRSVEDAVAEAGTGVDLQVPVHADATGLREEVDAARIEAEVGQEIKIKVTTDRSGLGGGGGGVGGGEQAARGAAEDASAAWGEFGQHWMKIGQSLLGNVWVLGALAGGLDALASAGGAALGAIAPLAGAVAALPGAVAVGGASFGTLFLGLSGVTKAAGELEKQQQSAGVTARQYADQQRSAAERVQSARQSLGNTEYEVGQQTVQAAQSVKNAEYNLQIAYRSERDALQGLMDARQAAARQLEDSVNSATDARLAAEGAQLSLEQARQQYAGVATDPNATKLQREQAQLAVDEAQQRLKEAQLGSKRAAEDNAKTQKRGIDGNLQVRAATEAVANSYHDVNQAVISLREAQQAQQHDAITGAQRIADAQRSLNDAVRAQREVTLQMQTTTRAANLEMNKLSPAGRRFAQILHGITEGPLKDLKQTAQTALLPGLGNALQTLTSGLLPPFKSIVTDTGHALGDMATSAARLVTSGPFTRDFTQLGKDNAQIIRDLTPGLQSVLNVLRNLAMAAMPLLDDMARSLSNDAQHLDDFIQKARDSGQLDQFFRKVGHTMHEWGAIVANVGGGIFHVLEAAYGPGDKLNQDLVSITKQFRDWTGSAEGQRKMHDFFEQGRKLAEALGHAVGGIVRGLAAINNNGALTNILTAIGNAGPGIGKLAAAFSGGFVGAFGTFARFLSDIAEHGGPAADVLKVFFVGLGAVAAGVLVAKATGLWKLAGAIKATVNAAKGSSGVIDFLKRLTGIGTPSGPVGRGGRGGGGGGIGGGIGGTELTEAAGALNEAAAALTAAAADLAESAGLGGLPGLGGKGKVGKEAEKGGQSLFSRIFRRGAKAGGGGATGEAEQVASKGGLLGRLGGLLGIGGGAAEGAGAAEGGGAIGGVIAGEASVPVVGWVAAGVTALGVAAYEAYKHWKPFHDAVNKTGHYLKTGFTEGVHYAKQGAEAVGGEFFRLGQSVGRELGKLPGQIGRIFKDLGKLGWRLTKDAVKLWLDVFVKWPIDVIKKIGHLVGDVAKFFGHVLSSGWQALEHGVPKLLKWFFDLPGRIFHSIGNLGSRFYNYAKDAFVRFSIATYNKASDLLNWFTGLPGRIFNAIGDLGSEMWNFGTHILEELGKGIWHAADDAAGWLVGGLKHAASKVVGWLNPFGDTEEGPMSASGVGGPDKMGARVVQEFGRGLASGAPAVHPVLSKIASAVAAALGMTHDGTPAAAKTKRDVQALAVAAAAALPKALQANAPRVARLLNRMWVTWKNAWAQLVATSGSSTNTLRGHAAQLAAALHGVQNGAAAAGRQWVASLQTMTEATASAVEQMSAQLAQLASSITSMPSMDFGGGYGGGYGGYMDPNEYMGPPLSVIHNTKQPKQTGLHSRIRAMATGGEVDAPLGQAVLRILHGGEYVLSVPMRQALTRFVTAMQNNVMGVVGWLASHQQQFAGFSAQHPYAAAAATRALRQRLVTYSGHDIGEGSGLAHVFQEGAIQVYNARPEPAAQSIATRLRRLRLLGISPIPPSQTHDPYAAAT